MDKPLGKKAYGSIPHLPNSRMGPADKCCSDGQYRICCEKTRDRHDTIYVSEKLDGSNCAVVKLDGKIIPLTRAGYIAWTSPYEQHHFFADWVQRNQSRFDDLLTEGERVVGEWLAQAHGTVYELFHEPFVPFDLMIWDKRELYEEFVRRVDDCDFTVPRLLSIGGSCTVEEALAKLGKYGHHGATEEVEGAVWRVERFDPKPNGRGLHVDFLCKWVRKDKVDGKYLPEVSGNEAIWHWKP